MDRDGGSEVWGKALEFLPGDQILVRAPSGRGKTSLVRFLTGESLAFSGTLFWEEKDVRGFRPQDWSRVRQRHLSLVPQTLNLLGDLSVEENILLRTRIQGLPDPDWKPGARFLGMSEALLETPVPTARLSQGEKQRVALLRSLQGPFSFLVLDEPFSHMQTSLADKSWDLIQQVCRERGAGILLTSLEGRVGWTGRELAL